MIDYVKNATKHYGTIFKVRQGLSKLRISQKDKLEDAEAEKQLRHSVNTDIVFLNNRMTHPNYVQGYRPKQNLSVDVSASSPAKSVKQPVVINEPNGSNLSKTIQSALNRK